MFARHDLVWLSGAGWDQALSGAPPEAGTALAAWHQAGWPAVVRRADAGQGPGELAIGIPLAPRPHDGRKIRVACRITLDAVIRHRRPLPLAQAVGMPPRWRHALAALAREAGAAGLELRVYGSAAMQAITGQACLTASSDIDLLLEPENASGLDAGLAQLHRYAAQLPLDGEIVFPGGRAVPWKEWAAALDGAPGTRVLVKEMTGVSLALPDALRASLEGEACSN